ncbi:hypothetical protein BY458DRAFT_184260 [Sporodiniella umbellata]|nr:hypothetical protein BY458DRAFT_184260 [Sporodiniella umbellata]
MTSQNINIVFKRNPAHSNGTGATAMSYSPSTHAMPNLFQHRDSFVHQRELESNFCSDLICCGTHIKDLHELLHHYEEHHHAPIEEETEAKENDIQMEGINEPFPSANVATVAPLVRNFDSFAEKSEGQPTSPLVSQNPNAKFGRHTEEILKQAMPSLVNTENELGPPDLHYFSSEALYQTCDDGQDKPYKCQMTGCDKAYKNPNGLKYHQMHGHTEEDVLSEAERDAQKPYVCTIGYCNKRYKNLNGLKYHIEHSHLAKLKQHHPLDNPLWQPNN